MINIEIYRKVAGSNNSLVFVDRDDGLVIEDDCCNLQLRQLIFSSSCYVVYVLDVDGCQCRNCSK